MKSLKNDFSLMSSLLIPVAVAINFTGSFIASSLKLPLFLDAIGTVFISLIAGPWVGSVTAVITSIATGGFNPVNLAFLPVGILKMGKQASVILDSQRSRGVETEGNVFVRFKALLPVFIPLVLGSIVNTEERAITLEARGFSIGEKRTILNELKETKNDKIVKIILVIFLILCIAWRILWVLK